MLLVDEPEISLHNAWQRMFAEALKKIVDKKHMRTIIATHSAQIINGNSKIQMELSAAEETACIVLVEGEDDITFVKRTFEESEICYESFSGKAGLDELMKDERFKRNEVIAISGQKLMTGEALTEKLLAERIDGIEVFSSYHSRDVVEYYM